MSPEVRKKKGRNPPTTDAGTSEHVLLNPEEWKDSAGVKVIKEYHKKDLQGSEAGPESDLDAFEQQWKAKGGSQTASEYHKQDAPDMEAQSEQGAHQPRVSEASKEASEEELHQGKEPPGNAGSTGGEKEVSSDNLLEKVTSEDSGKDNDQLTNTTGVTDSLASHPLVDISTVEVLAFTIFRAMFGAGVNVPLKIEGSTDMDIAVKGTDVVINTNDVTFEPPKLQIWHFIFAYKGKPVLEYGRGIDRIKVHYYRAFVMVMASWWGSKKKRKAKEKADKAADVELTRYAAGEERLNERNRTGGDQ